MSIRTGIELLAVGALLAALFFIDQLQEAVAQRDGQLATLQGAVTKQNDRILALKTEAENHRARADLAALRVLNHATTPRRAIDAGAGPEEMNTWLNTFAAP